MPPSQLKLPADQVISLAVQSVISESTPEELAEAEAEDEAEEGAAGGNETDKTVGVRVHDAAQQGPAAVVALMQGEPRTAALQWWCCDAIASLSAGKRKSGGGCIGCWWLHCQ